MESFISTFNAISSTKSLIKMPSAIDPEKNLIDTVQTLEFETLPERYGWQTENGRGYRIKEQLCGTERPLRVVAVGAGAAGICLAKYLPEQLHNVTLSIYDKNPELGGTWYENRFVAFEPVPFRPCTKKSHHWCLEFC